MRRRRWTPAYTTRPAYSSVVDAPSQLTSLTARLPTFLILTSFLVGWLLGRDDATRNAVVSFSVSSARSIQSVGDGMLILMGLAVRNECESADGSENVSFCSVSQLLGKLLIERIQLEQRMSSMKEYGSYYRQIFTDTTTKPTARFPSKFNDDKEDASNNPNNKQRRKQSPLFSFFHGKVNTTDTHQTSTSSDTRKEHLFQKQHASTLLHMDDGGRCNRSWTWQSLFTKLYSNPARHSGESI